MAILEKMCCPEARSGLPHFGLVPDTRDLTLAASKDLTAQGIGLAIPVAGTAIICGFSCPVSPEGGNAIPKWMPPDIAGAGGLWQ